MPSTVEKLSPTRAKLTVEIPFSDLKPSLDKAYQTIAEQVSLPGFRPGKVPPAVIDQRFGRGAVLQEAINDALQPAYVGALNEHQLTPLSQPEVEVTKLEDGDLVEFTAEVDVRPEIELPDLSDLAVEVKPIEVTDEQLDERVELMRQRFATTTEVERAAKDGDVVVLDLEGSRDGEKLEEATAEGITYQLGSGGMLDGLDEAVTGLAAGEDNTFTSTLVGGPLAGQEADVKVTVQKVSEQELPAVDDEFAQMVSAFDTVDEMKADLRDGLQRMARLDQATEARDKVLEAVIARTDFPLPQNYADQELDAQRNQIEQQLAQAGLTLEQYLADSDEEDKDPEAFWASLEKRTGDALRAQLILDTIADSDEIGVDQHELTELIVRKAQQSGTTPEQEANHMMEHNHMGDWMSEIRRGKALGQLVDKAEIKDLDGAVVDLSSLNPDGTVNEEAKAAADEKPAKKAAAKKAPAKKAEDKKAEDKKADEKSTEAKAEEGDKPKKAPAKKAAAKKAEDKKAEDKKADAEQAEADKA